MCSPVSTYCRSVIAAAAGRRLFAALSGQSLGAELLRNAGIQLFPAPFRLDERVEVLQHAVVPREVLPEDVGIRRARRPLDRPRRVQVLGAELQPRVANRVDDRLVRPVPARVERLVAVVPQTSGILLCLSVLHHHIALLLHLFAVHPSNAIRSFDFVVAVNGCAVSVPVASSFSDYQQ